MSISFSKGVRTSLSFSSNLERRLFSSSTSYSKHLIEKTILEDALKTPGKILQLASSDDDSMTEWSKN
jgi:hypothetical protein